MCSLDQRQKSRIKPCSMEKESLPPAEQGALDAQQDLPLANFATVPVSPGQSCARSAHSPGVQAAAKLGS